MAKNINNPDISIPDLVAALFFWILTVGWIILLFYLSNENGDTSSERSAAVVKFIESLFKNFLIRNSAGLNVLF